MSEHNPANVRKGQPISYMDMANPRRFGIVSSIHISKWGTQYGVIFEDGDSTVSDLRQRGWRVEPDTYVGDRCTRCDERLFTVSAYAPLCGACGRSEQRNRTAGA